MDRCNDRYDFITFRVRSIIIIQIVNHLNYVWCIGIDLNTLVVAIIIMVCISVVTSIILWMCIMIATLWSLIFGFTFWSAYTFWLTGSHHAFLMTATFSCFAGICWNIRASEKIWENTNKHKKTQPPNEFWSFYDGNSNWMPQHWFFFLIISSPMHELQAVPSPNAVAKKYSNSVISFSVKPTSSPPPQHFSLDTFRSIGCLHFPLCVLFAQQVPATKWTDWRGEEKKEKEEQTTSQIS